MSTKEKKTYGAEFKKPAVQMLFRGGRPPAQIAHELGVDAWALREWKKRPQPKLAMERFRLLEGEGKAAWPILIQQI